MQDNCSKFAKDAWRAAFDLQQAEIMRAARTIRQNHADMDKLTDHLKDSQTGLFR
jgi:hypothetical protein